MTEEQSIKKHPQISVIMGIFNCSDTLSDAIDSILNQSYSDWELIMCDDGSVDGTWQAANQYKADYPDKIILIQNEKKQRFKLYIEPLS